MTFQRCDETIAWAALQGHFEGHGRELNLQDAFAREADRYAVIDSLLREWVARQTF